MRLIAITLAGLLTSFSAVAAEQLSYTDRIGLYADWSTFIILILAVVALIRFWNK